MSGELDFIIRKNVNSEICISAEHGKWAIKITDNGLEFNKEGYPSYTADDFAKTFIFILESNFTVKFYKKES
jgi:hypothetical protein